MLKEEHANDAPPKAKRAKTASTAPGAIFSEDIELLIEHMSSEKTASLPFKHRKIALGKLKHQQFFDGIETIRKNTGMSRISNA